MRGFELARAAGFTHALQIDADGQHDLSKLPEFLALGESNPEALIAGAPIHDATMPRGRRIARSITHFWVGVETLTTHPVDTMCGLRLYPLEAVMKIQATRPLGRRMDFDVEIFVRLIWDGVPVVLVPVRVVYPPGNLSNFNLIRDNWLITEHAHAAGARNAVATARDTAQPAKIARGVRVIGPRSPNGAHTGD